jgi:hypothetical protein
VVIICKECNVSDIKYCVECAKVKFGDGAWCQDLKLEDLTKEQKVRAVMAPFCPTCSPFIRK